jgi:glycosyltransferase involved in cell wall biosynthesis
MPIVSVIIPSYNYGHFVSEAIESVLSQTYPHHEIIVVDDGSTDRTFEVVAHYPSVFYVRQENAGLSAARNRGIQECRGEYVVCLDADDRLLPQHFEISLEAFQSHPDVGWVCGTFRYFGNEPPWRYGHRCDPMPDHFGLLLRSNFIGAPHAVMYRRQVLAKSGGFDECLKSCEDWELYLRLIRQAPLYCHHQPIAEYRMTDQQMSRRWHVMLKWDFHVLRSQWRFVRGHHLYEDAYYEGMAWSRARYGERALWQMVADVRSGQWAQALKAFWVLLMCYPVGLVGLFKGKACKLFFIRRQSSL